MENLSLFLQDYKGIINNILSVIYITQFFAGVFICKNIYKKGSTDGISSTPFVGAIVIGTLLLAYSIILDDTHMLIIITVLIFLNILYLLFYFCYTNKKRDVMKSLGIGAILIAVLFGYIQIENEDLIKHRFGFIITILMLFLISSPLLKLKNVIRMKDASIIPFPIVLCGTLTSFLGLLREIILLNYFMIFQNVIRLILCTIQLILCFMYPGVSIEKKKNK